MTFLTDLALRRSALTIVLALALVGGGIVAAVSLNQELTPDLGFPILTVITTQPGADAVDLAEQVTTPVEAAVASVPSVRSIQSTSGDGLSLVVAQFDFGQDMRAAEQEVGRAVAALRLPQGVGQPAVSRLDLNQTLPVVQLSLSGSAPLAEIDRVAREDLGPKLAAIDGVASVDVTGGAIRRVDVVLDAERVRQAGLTTQQIIGALQASNVSIPVGAVPAPSGALPARVSGQLASIEALSDLVVGVRVATPAQPVAAPIRLRDVATTGITSGSSGSISRTNGRPSIAIALSKTQSANSVTVVDRVRAVIADSRARLGDRIEVQTVLDQSTVIRESIGGLTREGSIGALAAMVVVGLFLGVSSALVIGTSIPLSVLAALLLLWQQGLTLNILTLGGLTIAIGRVVDDSIVVLENVFRHVREGDDLEHAVRTGTREVSTAILGSTLTTVAVFAPLALTGGIVGVLFRPFALTVTYALLASYIVALTVIPVVARFFVARHLARGAGAESRTRLQRLYLPVLGWSLRYRALTLGIAALLFLGSVALIPTIPTAFISSGSTKQFQVSVAPLVPAPTPDQLVATAEAAERAIASVPKVRLFQTTINLGGTSSFLALASALSGRDARVAAIIVVLEPDADLEATARLVQERLDAVDTLVARVQGASSSDFSSQLQLSVRGEDLETVRRAGRQVAEAVAGIAGIEGVTSGALQSQPGLSIRVDPQRALGVGLTPVQVALQLRELTTPQTATRVRLGDERLDVVVRYDAAAVRDVSAVLVGRPPTPLGQIATIERTDAATSLTRLDQKAGATISGRIVGRATGEVNDEVRARVGALSLPPGVEVVYGGSLQQFQESFNGLFVGIGIAIVVVYVVMVLVMGSLGAPFAIMFSLPLALVGAVGALAVTHRALGLPALFGLLMLVGIVVSNGIVLIDFVQQLRRRGMSPREALLEGGRLRLRPVLMTAAATIVALVPMSLGLTEGAIIAAELATVVIGGLLTSTLMTLVVVPVVYTFLTRAGPRRSG